MKIMYLLFSFTVGGAEKLVADICNEMVKSNYVYLYIVNKSYSTELLNNLDDRVHKILYNRIPKAHDKLKVVHDLDRFIIDNKINVIHCNSLDAPKLLVFKPILFRHCIVVHTIHDVGQYKSLSKTDKLFRNVICYKFIAISESVKTDIIKNGASPDKTEVVYNAINVKKFSRIKKQSHNGIVIGNVARFMPEKKGQDILIEAVKQLVSDYPEIRCLFAGAPDKKHVDQFDAYKKKVQSEGLENNIEFLGNVEDIPSFLSNIDIFVLPSRYEGFGISLIEAMCAGIPCIASDLDGPSEIIGNDERGLLFKSGSVTDLVSKLRYVIENFQKISDEQQANVEYVKANFDIAVMCKKLARIYSGD